MEYTHLGRIGLVVSRLCLGTMNFGPQTRRPTATRSWTPPLGPRHQLLRHRRTSTGGSTGDGVTEEIIGRWFAQGGGRREKVVLATKVYGQMGDWPNESRLSALAHPPGLRGLAAAAADRPHRPLPDAPRRPRRAWDEIWQAMELLVQQGKVLYVGSPNFAGWHIAQANEIARAAPLPRASSSEQSLYNLTPARSSSRCSRPAGVRPGAHPVEPARRRPARRRARRRSTRAGAASEYMQRRDRAQPRPARGVGGACAPSSASSPPTWRWPGCCSNPVVTAPIIGPRTVEQLDGSLRALEIKLDAGRC